MMLAIKPNGKVDYIEIDRTTGEPYTGDVKEGWPVTVKEGIALGDMRPLEVVTTPVTAPETDNSESSEGLGEPSSETIVDVNENDD